MASSSRARVALIASGILLTAPAAAQSTDPPAPPPASPAKGEAPPPPPQARPMSQQPEAMTSTPPPPRRAPRRGPAAPRHKGKPGATPANGAPIAGAPAFFRLEDGSTRISVEVTTKVDVSESRAQGRLVYRLKGAYAAGGVNRLPLLTGFFPTPVDRAQLVQDGADVELVIDLREGTTPAHRVVETPRGIVLQVDFPKSVHAEHSAEPAVDTVSRDRAKRRATSQTLGSDRGQGEDSH